MTCRREDRERCHTIAFWLSEEEKQEVEAKIILSGLPKGEYYRRSVIGQEVNVTAGNYMSNRVAIVLENILQQISDGSTDKEVLLIELIKQLLSNNENAPAANKGNLQ